MPIVRITSSFLIDTDKLNIPATYFSGALDAKSEADWCDVVGEWTADVGTDELLTLVQDEFDLSDQFNENLKVDFFSWDWDGDSP